MHTKNWMKRSQNTLVCLNKQKGVCWPGNPFAQFPEETDNSHSKSCATAREKSVTYDLLGSCFWSVDHDDSSRWFAISSFLSYLFAVLASVLWVKLPKKKVNNWTSIWEKNFLGHHPSWIQLNPLPCYRTIIVLLENLIWNWWWWVWPNPSTQWCLITMHQLFHEVSIICPMMEFSTLHLSIIIIIIIIFNKWNRIHCKEENP